MIKTKDLEFNYDNQVFFKFPNINLKSNEDLLIIGSSGIGKTTLLHLLAGLLNSNSGSIELFGKELNQLSSHQLDRFRKNNIGIVFQRPHFVNSLTVKENLQLAQYIGNKSFEDDTISAGRNITSSATSWSFNTSGHASMSLTKRSAYVDDEMLDIFNLPEINGVSINKGILLPETQNFIFYDVVEDLSLIHI